MPISAVVITLEADPPRRAAAIEALGAHPGLMLGEPQGNQLPAVIETDTITQGVDVVREQLHAIDGVVFVHVLSVDFSDMEDFDEKLPPRRRHAER